MHAVETNNADMVHFLIEVKVCVGGEGKIVIQLSLICLVFSFQLINCIMSLLLFWNLQIFF